MKGSRPMEKEMKGCNPMTLPEILPLSAKISLEDRAKGLQDSIMNQNNVPKNRTEGNYANTYSLLRALY